MSGQQHPDTETLASLRAGLVGGFRGRRLAAHVARCARCAATGDELAAVSSLLAATPTPPLPASFEQRISAALAAETAARALAASSSEGTAAGPAVLGQAVLGQAGADPGIAGEHAGARVPAERPKAAPSRRRGPALRFRPALAFVPLVLFALAGFGYLLSTIGGPGNSSSSAGGFSTAAPGGAVPAAGPRAAAGRTATFVVTASGLNYLPSTLGSQVRLEMATRYSSSSGQQSMAPSASGAASHNTFAGASGSVGSSATTLPSGLAAPSSALSGCVLRVTGGVQPSLVDKATYQGRPAYVIAVPARVWVVERGCTASHPAIITTVALSATR
jgi:hypothetical protein